MYIAYVLIAAILYGVEPSIIKIILNNGIGTEECAMVCFLCSGLFAIMYCLITGKKIKITTKQLCWSVLCGILFFLVNYFLEVAYTLIPVGLVTTIHFAYPTIVFLISVIFYKEKITKNRIYSIILCVCGLLLISGIDGKINGRGIVIAFATAVFYSIYLIIIDKSELSTLDETAFSICVGITGFLCGFLLVGKNITLNNIKQLSYQFSYIVALGIMLFLASVFLKKGIDRIGSSASSVISVAEPLTSMIVSTIIFKYDISMLNIIGCVFIVLSIIVAFLHKKSIKNLKNL